MSADKIQDLYILSPIQTGILFRTLFSPENAVYQSQHLYTVNGELDPDVLERAWHYLVERHPVLRTSFHWEELDEPLQVVHESAPIPWNSLDWQGLSAQQQQENLRDLLTQ